MLFSRKDLTRLIVPLIFEQFLSGSIGVVSTLLVSHAGEAAVSGISLVDSINILLTQLFAALATGGAVICAQYLGKNDPEEAQQAGLQLYYSIFALALACALLVLTAKDPLIHLVFGDLEPEVYRSARIYYIYSALSYPFLALYNAGAALSRAMGKAKLSLYVSLIMNLVNLAAGWILIPVLHLEVTGAGIAALLARFAGAAAISLFLLDPADPLNLRGILHVHADWSLVRRILGIGIPSGIENSLFQVGKILVTSLISTFGTASIAAYAVANNVSTFVSVPSNAVGLAMLTVTGQCMGAGDVPQARHYIRVLSGIGYAGTFLAAAASWLLDDQVLQIYSMTAEAGGYLLSMIHIFAIFVIFAHIPSFALPNALRAAGDVRFTMTVSILSMWFVRVLLSYVLGKWLGMGIVGVWLAMCLEWIARAAIFLLRYRGDAWVRHKIV